jgi:hypothetical protein
MMLWLSLLTVLVLLVVRSTAPTCSLLLRLHIGCKCWRDSSVPVVTNHRF